MQFSEPTGVPTTPAGTCGSGPCLTNPTLQILNVLPIPGATGATGLSLGPNGRLWVGSAPNPTVMDKRTGAVLITYRQMSNPDENWYNPTSNQFINVSNTAGQQNLCFADAMTLAFIECDPVGTNHNVAADPANGAVFVLARVGNPICPNGCIEVFVPGVRADTNPASTVSALPGRSPFVSILPAPLVAALQTRNRGALTGSLPRG